MRDFFRYLLVLSVVGLGFYGASQHRVTDELPGTMGELAELEMPPNTPHPVGHTQTSTPTEVIPLAALLDAGRSSPNEAERESPGDLKLVPKIARQSTPGHKKRVEDTSAVEEVAGAEERASDADQTSEDRSVASPSVSESDQPRPSDPPRNDSTATSEFAAAARFPLPKLAIRPGNRFAVPDPTETDPIIEPKADERLDSPWDDPEPDDPDPAQQVAVDGSQSDPIPLAHTQPQVESLATKPSRSTLIHRVEAGDTLPKLAERYLGDREKYQAIFEANAQILPDPRLLPIGVDLEIPVLAATKVSKDRFSNPLVDDTQHDDPLDDLFLPTEHSERTSGKLEPIPPQALPNPPLDAWRPSLR